MALLKANTGIGTTNPTSALHVFGDGRFTGVVTATSFSGNTTSATYATTSGVSTYASTSGIATYATIAGVSTYSPVTGIATYATTAGISTTASTAGYATTSGISTTSQGLTGTPNITVGVVTATSYYGDGSNLTGVSIGSTLVVSTRTGFSGVNSTGDQVSNVTAIRFDKNTGFGVTSLGDGEVFVQLGSTFNPWYVAGQSTLSASGEESIEIIAGTGIAITTKATATGIGTGLSKALTITATGGGGTQNLNTTLGYGNTSSLGFEVGISTFTSDVRIDGRLRLNYLQYEDDSAITDFFYIAPDNHIVTAANDWTLKLKSRASGANEGNLWLEAGQNTKIKVKGNGSNIDLIASDGSTSATWNFNKNGQLTFPNSTIQTTAFVGYATTAGISTTSQGLTGTPNITVGVVTATSYYGDGSSLTGVSAGVGIQTSAGLVGTGATILDFRGSGISTITVASGIATINITGPDISPVMMSMIF